MKKTFVRSIPKKRLPSMNGKVTEETDADSIGIERQYEDYKLIPLDEAEPSSDS
ncbi:hypothetical protein [Sporosarcina sp. UB5]|uniref:hypothetical protein n=1 Tax=Sporosarcina sp. UB5 TaxID=3047463 RepID=UPI003D7A3456